MALRLPDESGARDTVALNVPLPTLLLRVAVPVRVVDPVSTKGPLPVAVNVVLTVAACAEAQKARAKLQPKSVLVIGL